MIRLFLLWTMLFLLVPKQAAAYIDAGTGSMIFQAIVAGIVGALFTIKMYWRILRKKLGSFFGDKKSDETSVSSDEDDTTKG